MWNKIKSWWKSIWSGVKSPNYELDAPDGTKIASAIPDADITIAPGTVPDKTEGSAKTLTNNNGETELK